MDTHSKAIPAIPKSLFLFLAHKYITAELSKRTNVKIVSVARLPKNLLVSSTCQIAGTDHPKASKKETTRTQPEC